MDKLISEAVLTKLFAEQIGGVSIFDLEGRYIHVNPIWEEAQNRKLDDVIGLPAEAIVPNSQVRKVLETGRPIFGFPIPEQGDLVWVLNYFPLYAEGRLCGCAMVSIFNNKRQVAQLNSTIQTLYEQISLYQRTLGDLQGAKYNLDHIIGASPPIERLRSDIQQAAASHSNVLIEGETGSGKELVAHSIHSLSQRTMYPFVKLNCAAIPMDLAESELFGYDSGAFTGAKRGGKKGKFELADRGSLFLDEINQLPYQLQPKLLRALQEREIERVGGERSIPLDVRIITATNQPLEKLILEQKFREDLYYRLNVYKIKVPPLRERLEDIPLLVRHYVHLLNAELGTMVSGVTTEATDYLMTYHWPGNIRELRNVLERAMNHRLHGTIEKTDFADIFCEGLAASSKTTPLQISSKTEYQKAKEDFDRDIILAALHRCGGNKKKVAEQLGISRAMLYKKIEQYHIQGKDV